MCVRACAAFACLQHVHVCVCMQRARLYECECAPTGLNLQIQMFGMLPGYLCQEVGQLAASLSASQNLHMAGKCTHTVQGNSCVKESTNHLNSEQSRLIMITQI